jgi:hypothetical protein
MIIKDRSGKGQTTKDTDVNDAVVGMREEALGVSRQKIVI